MATKFKKIKATGGRGGVFSKQVTRSGPTPPPIPADSRVRLSPKDPLNQQS